MKPKPFFRNRSVAEIRNFRKIKVYNLEGLVDAHRTQVENGSWEYYVQIMRPLFSERIRASTFSKYGPIVRLEQFDSAVDAIEAKKRPWQLLAEAIDNFEGQNLGYAIIPPTIGLEGRPTRIDHRPLVVPWKEIYEGHRVFSWAHQDGEPIILQNVYGSQREFQGADIVGKIPSRTRDGLYHDVELRHVPATALRRGLTQKVANVQFYIPLTIRPLETTEKRRYASLRAGMPGLMGRQRTPKISAEEILPVMWADVALYLEYLKRNIEETKVAFAERLKNGETIYPPAAEFTPFPLVTKFGVQMYLRGLNNTINHKGIHLRDSEINLYLGHLLKTEGYEKVHFAKRSKGGKIENYDWSVP